MDFKTDYPDFAAIETLTDGQGGELGSEVARL